MSYKQNTSINMKSFYKKVSDDINLIFENPDSLDNVKNAEEIVSEMLDLIINEEFTVSSLITILSFDYHTHTHSLNVAVYAACVGKEMGLSKSALEELGVSALLHDLGKSRIDDAIINKDGELTDEEFAEVQNHAFYGWLMVRDMGVTNKNILAGIRNHHERMDGNGYPDKLKNKEIHKYAKIIGMCDVFDALTTRKTYKESVSTFETLVMMKKEMSNHLDPQIINHFIRIFK